jgi:hypothetical protein
MPAAKVTSLIKVYVIDYAPQLKVCETLVCCLLADIGFKRSFRGVIAVCQHVRTFYLHYDAKLAGS